MSPSVTPGEAFAGYRVESLVGRGGMGVVYRATDLSLARPVALKLIAPEFAGDDLFRSRFLRESRLAASLDHPNVVPIYEAREADGQLYLAMRFVQGSDLRTLLARDGTLSPERTVAVLEQVASALDAANERGLVHRDVKPANVLVEARGHVYLTDFGVTKQVGHASTATGEIVGTLDYIAPEQIRGEPVDGRADVYALACVLYQCLGGSSPFRRETEAETLWAHMQEEPPALPNHPALDQVLAKGLAKDREDRYATCSALVEDASAALGLTAPGSVAKRPARTLVRRRRAIFGAGLAVLAATAAAATIALTGGDGSDEPPVDNGVAAIDAKEGRIRTFTVAASAPSNLAVGEGSVWVLNTQDESISRIDPETGEVVDTLDTGGRPTDLAVGAGAVWVGYGKGPGTRTAKVARIEPQSGAVTHTTKLPEPPEGAGFSFSTGFPGIAVGAGAVWATTPVGGLARIDGETGRIVATIRVDANALAAGEEGVWVVGDNAVTEIDTRTNKAARRIELGSNALRAVAVGAGSVWATSEEGLLWRIEPDEKPIFRSIDVGTGVAYVAFGDGSAWTANWVDGMVARIDPRTNTVAARVPVGATQALAAGEGAAWVSVAGRPRDGTLPDSTCGKTFSGGRTPDVLIASDLPLQDEGAGARAMVAAIRAVLAQRRYRAGDHVVGYRSCDDSTAQTGGFEHRKCAANANAYARAENLVAVIGPFNSFCAQIEIPIMNAAPDGPLTLISPSNTFPNLTRGGALALPPPYGVRGEPDVYYPTGERNFLRMVARGDLAGNALAELADDLGVRSAYLVYDDAAGDVLFNYGFRRRAPRLGLEIAGHERFSDQPRDNKRLVERIARSGADAVVVGGHLFHGGNLVKALRARFGSRMAILTGDGFLPIPEVIDVLGNAADGLYVALPDVPPSAIESRAGGRVVEALGQTANVGYTLQAAAAAEAVLEAIERSDGTRASVLRELRSLELDDGIIGPMRFDRYGDVTPGRHAILRIDRDVPRRKTLPGHRGAVLDRMVDVPTDEAR